jgi:hypothetical protein
VPPRPPKRDDRRPLLEALEPRILLSADVDAALLGGALLENGDDAGAPAEVVLLEDGEEVAQLGSIVERRHEIVFVDSGLEDHGALVDALRSAETGDRELEVVLIDAERDGIEQITDVLSDHSDLDAVHIVSHGAEAAVQLGSSWLMADNLDAHTGSLLAWSDALSEDADLLFYGCNLAGGDEGAAFAESLAKLTGADVGASTDATGSALLGGDWNLELRLGDVESEIAIDAQLRQSWTGILDNAPPTHSVPGTQTTDVDTSLVFSDGAGNGIAIDDPDAGGNQVEVTLAATNGTLTLTGPGAVIDVNAETSWTQESPRVASNGAGNSVVVWASDRQDGDGWGIYAQLYDATGNAVGSEFRVNGPTAGDQLSPDVSMNANGEFVVVWQSADGDGTGIFAQRFDASGTAIGGELLVNTEEQGDQTTPVVAMAADGSFAVAWQSQGQDGDASGIYAQRFDSAGAAQGAELRVNSETADDQTQPAIAMDADGDFVVVWQSQLQDGADGGIYGQRFDANGIARGAEFRVNSEIANEQGAPDVAMDAAGNFVVAWESLNQDGSSWGIFAQRYDASGAAQGAEFQVNTVTQNQQRAPSVSMDADGDFVVAWQGKPGSWDSFGQQFDAAGNPIGAEFQINQTSGGNQTAPDVAMDADGDFKAVWTGKTPGDNDGIAARDFLFTKGLSFTTGDGIDDASIVIRGTLEDLNDALDGLTFTPTAGFSGLASVVITTDDLGNTGVGGPLSTNDTVYVIVGDVPNLAPILDASGELRLGDVDEDAGDPSGDTVADILTSVGDDPIFDIDPGALEGIAVVAVDDSHGTWQFSIDGGSTWTDFGAVGDASAALLDTAAHVRFVPAPDYVGPAGELTFRAWDQTTGSNGQTGVDTTGHGGSSAFSSETETATLDVRPVNDAPVNHLPGNQLVEEGGVLIFSQAGGNAISIDDAEANVVRLTLEVSEGALSLADISGLAFDAGDGTADAMMTFSGALSAVNAALDGLTYEAAEDFSGVVTLRMLSDDLGGAGAGGPLDSESLLSISVTEVVFPDLGDDDPEPGNDGEDPEDEADPEADGGVSETAPSALATPLTPIGVQPVTAGADRATPTLPRTEPDSDPDSSHADAMGPGVVELAATEHEQGFGSDQRRTPEHRAQAPVEGALYQALDQLRDRMAREADLAETPGQSVFASVRAVALVVSTGVLTALLRGGSLLALTFSSLPLWNGFDPLAVLALTREERKKRGEELREAQRAEDRGAAGLGDLLDTRAGTGADEGAGSAPDPEHSDRGATR